MENCQKFTIKTQWDGRPLDSEASEVSLTLIRYEEGNEKGVELLVSGPFYNSPGNPGGEPGKPFPQLWDYEVVEAFFLSADGKKYLEVELCPHGQHLVLLLSGCRNCIKDQLPLCFSATTGTDKRWIGRAKIPASYFPPNVAKFNAYAIHGAGEERTYEALYPTPTGKYEQPNFHRLEYFQPIDFEPLLPENRNASPSELWT